MQKTSEFASRIAEKILDQMSDGGYAVQVIGPWCKNHPQELEEQIQQVLKEKGVQTVMLCDHLEVYIKADMDEEEKSKIFEELKTNADSIYKGAVEELEMERRVNSVIADILIAALLGSVLDDDDEDDEEEE